MGFRLFDPGKRQLCWGGDPALLAWDSGQGAREGGDVEQVLQGNFVLEGLHAPVGVPEVHHGPEDFDIVFCGGSQVARYAPGVEVHPAAVGSVAGETVVEELFFAVYQVGLEEAREGVVHGGVEFFHAGGAFLHGGGRVQGEHVQCEERCQQQSGPGPQTFE